MFALFVVALFAYCIGFVAAPVVVMWIMQTYPVWGFIGLIAYIMLPVIVLPLIYKGKQQTIRWGR